MNANKKQKAALSGSRALDNKTRKKKTSFFSSSSKNVRESLQGSKRALQKLIANPNKSDAKDRRDAVESINKEIANARSLPPGPAGILLRALYALRQALLDLDGQSDSKNDSKNDREKDKGDSEKESGRNDKSRFANLEKASADYKKALDSLSRELAAAETFTASNEKLAKVMTKDAKDLGPKEIVDGIIAIEDSIAQGKAMLPADAGILLRALYALRMALFELAEMDPKLVLKGKDNLHENLERAVSNNLSQDPVVRQRVSQSMETLKAAYLKVA